MALRFRELTREEPDVNLIPFIDVLLVVLIFLMLTTTFTRYTELRIDLAQARGESAAGASHDIVVTVGPDGRYQVDATTLTSSSGVEALTRAIQEASQGHPEAALMVRADGAASHQAVVKVMDAARRAGLTQIAFSAQLPREP
jgi:biopolymer transport protein ExbD